MIYEKCMLSIGLDQKAIDLACGRLQHPSSFVETNVNEFVILPAMIPIWRESLNTTGIWKHWFEGSRYSVFAVQKPEFDYQVFETARSLDQLAFIECYKEISATDGFDQGLKNFCGYFPAINQEVISALYKRYDFDQTELARIEPFKNDPPLYCEPTQYKGDFPSPAMPMTAEYIRKTCTVEYDEDLKQRIAGLGIAPEWFKTTDQAPLFYRLLDKTDFAGAWMCLNSNGWEFAEAKKAILKLADKASDADFTVLANIWASQPHEKYGSY